MWIFGALFVGLWAWLMIDLFLNEEEWLEDFDELEEEFWNKNT